MTERPKIGLRPNRLIGLLGPDRADDDETGLQSIMKYFNCETHLKVNYLYGYKVQPKHGEQVRA